MIPDNALLKPKRVQRGKTLDKVDRTRSGIRPDSLLQSILDSLCVAVALLDGSGEIVATNGAWENFVRSYSGAPQRKGIGEVFRGFYRDGICKGLSTEFRNGLDLVLAGKRNSFEATTRLNKHAVSCAFRVRVARLPGCTPRRLLVTIEKHSAPPETKSSASEFAHRILEIQANERQRFAAELHDTVGQYFVSLELLLARLRMEMPPPEPSATIIQDMSAVLKQAQAEIRTLAYFLSPRWVEYEQGLEKAIRSFVHGFAKRAELKAHVHVHGSPLRLDQSRQVTLFRIVQEALVNVYRHANADAVAVELGNRRKIATLRVRDNGNGFSTARAGTSSHGAGLAGMRARIKQFGGELHIDTDPNGTILTATLPTN